jgi:signal transduction histidine kinase
MPAWIRQRRWWLVLLLAWVVAVGLTWRSHVVDIRRQSLEVSSEGARNIFRMVVLARSWNASHGGVYVPVTSEFQPNLYLLHGQRDVTTTGGLHLTLVNPYHMSRLIAEMARLETGAVFRLTSRKPMRPENAPDTWEDQSLQAFEKGIKETVGIEDTPQGEMLRYMAPLRTETECLSCHAHQGHQLGDIRGGISVSQLYAPIEAYTKASIRQSTLTYLGVFLLVCAAGALALEMLRRRWMELGDKIFELSETRSELVQSEKMASLGRMVAGFAHEINTPVGVAVGAVSQNEEGLRRIEAMLTTEEVDETQLRSELDSLREGGALAMSNLQRAARLVQSFKRTSTDQTSEEPRTLVVRELFTDVLFTLHNVLKRLPIQTHVECAPELKIHGPAGLLEQVMTNLVLNAVQHAFGNGARSGNLTLRASRTGNQLILQCEDDGCGMPADQAQRVFEPFYTTRRGQGGTGLGLYICYQIATTQLGGTIQCVSTLGKGSIIEMRFDAQFADSPASTAQP